MAANGGSDSSHADIIMYYNKNVSKVLNCAVKEVNID